MNAELLKNRLIAIFPNIDLESKITDQLDSLQIAILLNAIEDEFKISFPSAELVFMKSFDFESLLAKIEKRLSVKAK